MPNNPDHYSAQLHYEQQVKLMYEDMVTELMQEIEEGRAATINDDDETAIKWLLVARRYGIARANEIFPAQDTRY